MRKGRGSAMLKKLTLLGFSICFMVLLGELLVRYLIPAWPFETALYMPDHLTPRDIPLQWRFSPLDGRNSLGLVLLSHAWLVASDSGGVQEEAPTRGKPLLILRRILSVLKR
jgi:hypothetical protein